MMFKNIFMIIINRMYVSIMIRDFKIPNFYNLFLEYLLFTT